MNPAIAEKIGNSSSLNWGIDYQLKPEVPARQRIRLDWARVPAWAPAVIARLVELAELPADPRGGRPLEIDDVGAALRFLSRIMRDDTAPPWIGRLSTGGLQLTWNHDDVEVEAVFDRARDEHVLMVSVGDNEWEAPINSADSLFVTVVDRLTATHP